MSKVIGVITARMASTRLPGKILKTLAGKSIFEHHVERMKCVEGLDDVFVATSKDSQNEELIKEAERLGCGWLAGAEQDIVDRHIQLCEREKADAVIRVTCDCPIFNIESASRFVREFKKEHKDYIYVSNMTMIQGTLSELISYEALCEVHKHHRGPVVTAYIKENLDQFNTLTLEVDLDLIRPEIRLTIDELIDIQMIGCIYDALYEGEPLDLHKVYTWLDDHPNIVKMNAQVGIKGCEVQSSNLIGDSVYAVMVSGKKHVILDDQKRMVDPLVFIQELEKLFPELKKVVLK